MIIKKFEDLNENTDQLFGKLSRILSNYFYPNENKNTYPIKCNGYTETETDYVVYFSVWENNKYKSSPITTILVPKHLLN